MSQKTDLLFGTVFLRGVFFILSCLSPDEIKILDLMFFNEEKTVSDMEMARKLNIPRRTFGYQKEKIFNKLKKSFATF